MGFFSFSNFAASCWPRGRAPASVTWRDAVRGARWGLEYLDLFRDIWASELTSQ